MNSQKADQLLCLYPTTADLLYAFSGKLLEQFQRLVLEGVPEDEKPEVPEIVPELIKQYAVQLMVMNPRSLYDFFDEQELYATVKQNSLGGWVCHVNGQMLPGFAVFDSRREAEEFLFEESFEALENKLKNEKSS